MDRFSLLPVSYRLPCVRVALLLLAAVALPAWLAVPARAGVVTGLFSFTGPPNGLSPASGPVRGNDGNFYGTISQGGARNNGTIYRITPAGALTTLYSFTGGADGAAPMAGLVLGKDGNFYGTTPNSGTGGYGTVFQFTPAGVLTTLFSFSNDADGGQPTASLVQGRDGNFYGTTKSGALGVGTFFRITPAGTLTTLYSFDPSMDGYSVPNALLQGKDGNFYGAALLGGADGDGTIFRITPDGALTTLYAFTGDTDGGDPNGGLAQDAQGNLYGTTTSYGGDFGQGTVFRVTLDGTLTTLHTFGYYGDGGDPSTGLVQGSDGNFYGATNQGGDNNLTGGTIFQITATGVFTTLYSFSGGADGSLPGATLTQNTDGSLYGVTVQGGTGGYGTVFRVTTAGALTTLFTFVRGADALQPTVGLTKGNDGNFYGTTQEGGLYNDGTVFRVTPAGVLTTIYNFTNGTDGTGPAVALTLGNDGNLVWHRRRWTQRRGLGVPGDPGRCADHPPQLHRLHGRGSSRPRAARQGERRQSLWCHRRVHQRRLRLPARHDLSDHADGYADDPLLLHRPQRGRRGRWIGPGTRRKFLRHFRPGNQLLWPRVPTHPGGCVDRSLQL